MSGTEAKTHSCRVCGSEHLSRIDGFNTMPRVTSDCKVWPKGGTLAVCDDCGAMQKLIEPKWLEEINQIYSAYTIYHQSGGAEQPIFQGGEGEGKARSARILDYLNPALKLGEKLDVLDFGCGSGSALKTYSQMQPGWRLYGSELFDFALPTLKKIPGFVDLFTVPPEKIGRSFDLVTSIHSMEHVLDPVDTFRSLGGIVSEGGHLCVQVPDCGRTPYDLAIADHLTHFTLESLVNAANIAGMETVEASNVVLFKELTWVGRAGKAGAGTPKLDAARGKAMIAEWYGWLRAQLDQATAVAAASANFGVFGTSISGTWLYGALPDKVRFFVDEDPGRVGRTHYDRPILHPDQIPAGADLYIPLVPDVAAKVAARIGKTTFKTHTPPPLAAL